MMTSVDVQDTRQFVLDMTGFETAERRGMLYAEMMKLRESYNRALDWILGLPETSEPQLPV
jgi:hypothetical protein